MTEFAAIVIVALVAGVLSVASVAFLGGDASWWVFWTAVFLGSCVAVGYLRRRGRRQEQ